MPADPQFLLKTVYDLVKSKRLFVWLLRQEKNIQMSYKNLKLRPVSKLVPAAWTIMNHNL